MAAEPIQVEDAVQHVFIIGAKSIGQYGGYETFVNRLIQEHESDASIRYHVVCKANGDGAMDESMLDGVTVTKRGADGQVEEFEYCGAHVFKLRCPNLGPAVAVWYDRAAFEYSLDYCVKNSVKHPIFYVLTCRIGPFIKQYAKRVHELGGCYLVNPDGHEWKRAKWPPPVRAYWKLSERKMVASADLVVCDSVNIETYIQREYSRFNPRTTFIAYGADVEKSPLANDDAGFMDWMRSWGLTVGNYYLVVGRFVPENNFETMLREYMSSDSTRDFVLITNVNDAFLDKLESKLHFRKDARIKFVGTVYNAELLKNIRENAFAYLHGHEVGGTNPSLLEALGSTKLNLLLDVGFNREVGQDAALYWNKDIGNLCQLINLVDGFDEQRCCDLEDKAKNRIREAYSWELIGRKYKGIWSTLFASCPND